MTEENVVLTRRPAGPADVVSLPETPDAGPEPDTRAAPKESLAPGGDVVLLSPSPVVASVLRLTRRDQLLEAFDDEGAALGRLAG